MAKKRLAKKQCEMCGNVFLSASNAALYCPECAVWRRNHRCGKSAIRARTKLTGNMAQIERVNREAARLGLSYGRLEGKRYAEKHVRVERGESNNE